MRKKSLTLVCRLSMSLTTKTLEHVVPAYNLPRGHAVRRGKVAEAAQQTAEAEAPHAAQPAQAPAGPELAHNPVLLNLSRGACSARRGAKDRGEYCKWLDYPKAPARRSHVYAN